MSNETLGEIIDRAFGERAAPNGSLVKGSQIEAQQVQDFFAGKTWRKVTLEALQKEYVGDGSACLWFMAPLVAAYYLPAYLMITAVAYAEADAISAEFVIKLRRVAEGEDSDFAKALKLLSDEQNFAVSLVLKQVATQYEATGPIKDASLALALKWERYLTSSRNTKGG
jgi:hypothetical protein